MTVRIFLTVILFMFAIVAAPANAKTRVAEFTGTDNTTTRTFRVESPWDLDWRLDGDYDQLVGLENKQVEANTGKHDGRVLYTKRSGNGVKIFYSAGSYQLRISSTLARWTVKIDQLTREEAELYSPKGSN